MSAHLRHRNRLPAERARHMKRVPRPDDPFTSLDGGGIALNQTVVFTVTSQAPEETTSTAEIRSTTTVFTTAPLSTETSSSATMSPSVVAAPSQPASSSVAASSAAAPTIATSTFPTPSASAISAPSASSSSSGGNAQGVQSGALTSGGLPGGAIAGIVIAIVLVLVGVVLFLLRNRLQNRRRSKSAMWLRNPTVTPFAFGGSSNEKPFPSSSFAGSDNVSPGSQFAQSQARALRGGPPVLAMPGASYNNMPFSVPSQNGAVVKSTFIPSLPDELSITTGETVRVMQEFDDGWALCANGGGEQGMVPLECLDRAGDAETAKRTSSLYGVSTIRR